MDNDDLTKSFVSLSRGAMVSHYRIVEKIGAGGMGEVYLAEDTKLERKVALKFMPQQVVTDPERRARFIREAKSAARLNHPNIVTVYDVDDKNERPFYTMEHVEGNSLSELLNSDELQNEQIIDYICQIAEALADAHEAGIIHRDIKPANIVIDTKGRARLLDFGLARLGKDQKLTREGTTLGTLAYMSPEQIRNDDIDKRTDIYSLGITLFQLLTGTIPFHKENEAATINAILNEDLPSVSDYKIELPFALNVIVTKMTEKDPQLRYHDAGTLKSELAQFKEKSIRAATSDDISIAVLPFDNMSNDTEQDYFCDGITEDIINNLTQVPELRVVARTSAFTFKGKNVDIRQVGKILNVSNIVEGSVRKVGDRVRVTAQLIKVADGFHLWSEKYDRKLDDIFAIQDDISRTIVDALKLKLTKIVGAAGSDEVFPLEAYDLYSKGRYNLNLRTATGFEKALACFEEALKIYPNYALAHAGIADTYFFLFAYDIMEPKDAIAKSRNAVNRAIELTPWQAEAYTTLGGILSFYDWAWEEAKAAIRKAMEFGPGYVTAHQWYGELLSYQGRTDEAEKYLLQAQQMDPLSSIVLTMLSFNYIKMNKPKKAVKALTQAIESGTDNEVTYTAIGFAYLALNSLDKALEMFDEACRRSDNGPYSITMKAHGLALMGKTDETKRAIELLERRRNEQYVPEAYLAALCLDIGDDKSGIAWLEKAIRQHNTELIFMATMPYYDNIRKNERVKTLLSVVRLSK